MATTVAAPARVFGSGIKRREDPRLLTGTARYTADMTLPGQLYAAILRSPHGHARIRKIYTGAAKAARMPRSMARARSPAGRSRCERCRRPSPCRKAGG